MTGPVISEPSVLYGLPEDQYHRDPIDVGSLSHSGAKTLLQSPALYQWERTHPTTRDTTDFGIAAHRQLLGTGAEIVVVEADDWKTKAAQEARKEARAEGKVALLRDDHAKTQEMVRQLRAHPLASVLFDPDHGDPEVSAFWVDDETGVWRRCRWDWMPHRTVGRRVVIPDYKTSVSADPRRFGKTAGDFGYHSQADWYLTGAQELDLADEDAAFLFVIQAKTPPFLVSVCQLDAEAMEKGRIRNRVALETYRECADKDDWPGYAEEVHLVSVPPWTDRDLFLETA